MFSMSWMQRNVTKQVMGQICQNGFSGDVARRSDRKRTEVYNISQVIQLLADSSDDSGSDLNLSDLDIGGNSSASESDVEGGDIPRQYFICVCTFACIRAHMHANMHAFAIVV